MKYVYQAVCGAGVFGGVTSIKSAKYTVSLLRPKWPAAEVERIQVLANGSRRYWRWRGGKWSVAQHYDPSPRDLARWSDVGISEVMAP